MQWKGVCALSSLHGYIPLFIYFDVRFQIRGGISNQGQISSFEYQKKDQMTLLLCCEEFLQNINRQMYISIYPEK